MLNHWESYFVYYFDTWHSKQGLNLRDGGGTHGRPSYESRSKMGEWQKGRHLSETHRRNIGLSNVGKKHSASHIIYISNLYKGRPLLEETKRKISIKKKGVKLSEQAKLKQKGKGSKAVVQLDKNGALISEYTSAKEAGIVLHFWKSDITQCCLHNRKTVKGFVFMYKKEYINQKQEL